MARALRETLAHTDDQTEIWYVAAPTPERTLLIEQGRVAITMYDTEGVAGTSRTYGALTVGGIVRPGTSLRNVTAGQAGEYAVGVATDGTWTFDTITGATLATRQGTPVYVIVATGVLTLTAGSNVRVGTVNYTANFAKVAGTLPIKIGA